MTEEHDPRMKLTLKDIDPCHPKHWTKEKKETPWLKGEMRDHGPDEYTSRWQKPYGENKE